RHPAGSGAAGRHRVPARRHPRRRARRRGDGRRRRRAPPRGARAAQQGGPPPLARQRGRHAAGARRGTRGGRRVLHPRLHQRRLRAARTLPDHRPHAAPPAGGLRARQAGGRGARGRGRARRARLRDRPAAHAGRRRPPRHLPDPLRVGAGGAARLRHRRRQRPLPAPARRRPGGPLPAAGGAPAAGRLQRGGGALRDAARGSGRAHPPRRHGRARHRRSRRPRDPGAPPARLAPPLAALALARPRQWTKNAVVFAALVFAGRLGEARAFGLAALTGAAFCLASSAAYAFNDVCDRADDRTHPSKRTRPVAAGRLGAGTALGAALVFAAAALALSSLLPAPARAVLGCFLALNLLYSLGLKRVAILDVMVIAFGFVLRVEAGIAAIAAPESAWIVLCMFFVAPLLGCGKRRAALAELPADTGGGRRAVLGAYSLGFLDLLLAVSATTAIVCYALYAVSVQANETFLLTVLPVV